MSIRFRCPFCKKPLKLVNTEKKGLPMQCPNPVCKKWIVFNDNGLPQESAPVSPPVGTRPQQQEDWLRVDGIDDDQQLKKFKRVPEPAPTSSRVRSRQFDRARFEEEETEAIDASQAPDLPPVLPSYGDDEADEPPAPSRGNFRQAPPLLPPPPRAATRRPPIDSGRGGGGRALLIAILLLSVVGIGVAGYFIFTRETTPAFVRQSYGVIEISTKAIKAVIVAPYPEGDSYDYEVIKEFEPLNISAGNLEEDGKSFDERSFKQALNAIQNFFEVFQKDPYNLPLERIAIVRSSGVVAGFKDKETLEKNRLLLEDEIRKLTRLKLDAFSPEDEAKYTAYFVIPERDRSDSMLIDIGSGNIKGGYFNKDGLFLATDADTGTSRFAKEVDKVVKTGKSDFQTVAKGLSRTLVFDKLKRDADNNPGLLIPKKIYFCGGLTWVLRTYTHPNDPVKQLIVELTAEDIDKFRKLVIDTPAEKLNETILAEVKDAKQREEIEGQLKKIQGIFKPEAVRAGAEILTALSEVYQFPKKRLLYYSNGPVAPNMGFVLYQLGLAK